jgi:D-alanyl-D-alanine carboxypeptidase
VSGDRLKPDQPVRIASNTKTFVAAAVLRLWEDRRLDVDESIVKCLSPEALETLTRGGYSTQKITIRHLLTHTSGLYDFGDSKEYARLCAENPGRRWTRNEQLGFAMQDGKPLGEPGMVFAYSDTGYILLGEILQVKTGRSMAEALRVLVGFERIGLRSTWWETLEPRPPGILDRAHQYEGTRDTYSDDPSYDLYGGGGLVSTVSDLAKVMRAIFTGNVYRHPDTLKTMLSTIPGTVAGPPSYGHIMSPGVYRMGVFVEKVEGLTVYSHTGYWGTEAAYVPDLDLAVGLSVTQQEAREARGILFQAVLRLIKERN